MASDLNTYVTFRSDVPRPSSILEPAGADLAELIAAGLQEHGLSIERIESEEPLSTWITCQAGTNLIELWVGLEDHETDLWFLLPKLPKKRWFGVSDPSSDELKAVLQAVDDALQGSERVWDVRWYPHFESSDFLALVPPCSSPLRDSDQKTSVHPLIKSDRLISRLVPLLLLGIAVIFGGLQIAFPAAVERKAWWWGILWIALFFGQFVAHGIIGHLMRRAANEGGSASLP